MPKHPEGTNSGATVPEKITPQLPEEPREQEIAPEDVNNEITISDTTADEDAHEELAQLGTPEEFKKVWEERLSQWEKECNAFINKVGTFPSLKEEIEARAGVINSKPDTFETNERLDFILEKLESKNGEAATDIERVEKLAEIMYEVVDPRLNQAEQKITEQGAWPGALRGIHEAMKSRRGVQSPDELKQSAAKMLEAAPEQAAMAHEVLSDPFLSVAAFRSIEQSVDRELTGVERHFATEIKPLRERIKADPLREQKFKQYYQIQKTRLRAPKERQAALIIGLEDYDALDKLEHKKIMARRPLVDEKRAIDAYVQSLQGEYSKQPSWTNFAAEQFTVGMALQEKGDAQFLFGPRLARNFSESAKEYQKQFAPEIEKFQWSDERKAAARKLMQEIWPRLNVFVPHKASGERGLDSRTALYLLAITGLRPSDKKTRDERDISCEPGKKHAGAITINSGNVEGIESPIADRAKDYIAKKEKIPYRLAPQEARRLVIDHHGEESKKKYSASRYLYNTLNELGFFDTPEFERVAKLKNYSKQAIEKLLTFVDEEDNKTNEFWHNQPADWWTKHAPDTILTLGKAAHPLGLLRYFEQHELKETTDPLTRQEVDRLDTDIRPEESLRQAQIRMRETVRHATESWSTLKSDKAYTQYEKKNNEVIKRSRLLLESPTYGKVVLTTHGFPGSVDGVRAMAGKNAVYIIYQTGRDAFFVSTTEKDLPAGFMSAEHSEKRGMWVRGDKSQPLPNLDELLQALGITEELLSEEQRSTLNDFTDTKRYAVPGELLGLNLNNIHSHKWVDALAAHIKMLHETGTGTVAYTQQALDKEVAGFMGSLEDFYKEEAKNVLRENLETLKPKASRKRKPRKPRDEEPAATAEAPEQTPAAPPERMSDEVFEQKLKEQMAILTENLYNKYRKELDSGSFAVFGETTKDAMARDYAKKSALELEAKVRAQRKG